MDILNAYHYIYLSIVTLLTIPIVLKYRTGAFNNYNGTMSYKLAAFFVALFFIMYIGLRPISGVFVDMMNYKTHYEVLYYGMPFNFSWGTENFLFDNYYRYLASIKLDISFFFFTIAVVYFGAAFIGIRRLFPNHTFAVYLMFLAAFSTYSYATNGIKAGCAASVFVLALSYWKKLKICIPLMIITIGIHHSMKMPVAAFAIAYLIKNPKLLFWGWGVCFFLSLAHVTIFQEIFSSMAEDANGYLDISSLEGGNLKPGFRFDFVLYSVMPILVGYVTIIKKKLIVSPTYRILLYTYIISNAIWLLCMYASFTNRIAYLSWLMYPVVLAYPFLYEQWGNQRYQTFAKVMLAHLGFTLFMELIFYA